MLGKHSGKLRSVCETDSGQVLRKRDAKDFAQSVQQCLKLPEGKCVGQVLFTNNTGEKVHRVYTLFNCVFFDHMASFAPS